MSDLIERIRADIKRPQVKRLSGKQWRSVEADSPGVLNIIGPSFTATVITAATDLNGDDYIARNADARRIARVPELESRILADAEALKAADALAEAFAESYQENLWDAYNTGHERDGKWTHHFMSDGEWLARELGFDATAGWYDAEAIKAAIPKQVERHPALTAYRKARGGKS